MKTVQPLTKPVQLSHNVARAIAVLEYSIMKQEFEEIKAYMETQLSIFKEIQAIPDNNTPLSLIRLLSLRIKLYKSSMQYPDYFRDTIGEKELIDRNKYEIAHFDNFKALDEIIQELEYIAENKLKKTFNLELTKEELLNSKGEVFMTNYLGLVIEGEEIRPQTLNYRIRLTDEEFPIILKGSKFVSISERTEEDNYYLPSTNPEILKFLIND